MSYVDPILAKMDISSLSREQRWDALDKHYDRLRRFLRMVANGQKSLIVNGDAGMGKTEFTNDIIKEYSKRTKTVCGKISGTLSAVDLFQRLHKFRKKGQVLIIDDTDRILETTESLEVLKSALDTKEDKTTDWGKAYSQHLARHKCPTEFKYEGRLIIITNKNLRTAPSQAPTAQQSKISPLLSRVAYFPAGLPSVEWKIEALRMFANETPSKADPDAEPYTLRCAKDIIIQPTDFSSPDNMSEKDIRAILLNDIIDTIEKHKDDIREISFRTVFQAIGYYNAEREIWEEMFITDQYYS